MIVKTVHKSGGSGGYHGKVQDEWLPPCGGKAGMHAFAERFGGLLG